MVSVLVLLGMALRSGLKLRGARLRRGALPRGARQRHLRIAKPALVLACLGFLLGPLSTFLLRGWTPFSTLHGALGTLAAALLIATGLLGRALERAGSGEASEGLRERHARMALLAAGVSALAAFAGFVLLP